MTCGYPHVIFWMLLKNCNEYLKYFLLEFVERRWYWFLYFQLELGIYLFEPYATGN